MLLGCILIAVGAVLMIFGVVMLAGWVGGKSGWFPDAYQRYGQSKTDRQLLDISFMAIVLAPILFGGVFIVFGLRSLSL